MVKLVSDSPKSTVEIKQSGLVDTVKEAIGKGQWYGEWSDSMNEEWLKTQADHRCGGSFEFRFQFEAGKKRFSGLWTALDRKVTSCYTPAMDAFCDALVRWRKADDTLRVNHRFTLALWRRAGRNLCVNELIHRDHPKTEFSSEERSELIAHVDSVRQAHIALQNAILAAYDLKHGFQCRLQENGGTSKNLLFRNGMIWSSPASLTDEQFAAVIESRLKKDQLAILRATSAAKKSSREHDSRVISVEVRREVWRRDGGRCCACQTQERLEFDHIIPVSMGGSNTVRNIQLLCEPCNRQKSSTLG